MTISYSKLREKEVINLANGRRIGYVCDLTLDTNCGKICEIIVSEYGFSFGEKRVRKIEWCRIRCIGDDAILVELPPECDCSGEKRGEGKRGLLF